MSIVVRRIKTWLSLRRTQWSRYVSLFIVFLALYMFFDSLFNTLLHLAPGHAFLLSLSDNAQNANSGQTAAMLGTMGTALVGYEVSTLTKFPNPSLAGPDPISLSTHAYDVYKAGKEGGPREAMKQNVRSTYSTVFGATGLDQKMGPMVESVLNFGE